MSSISLSDDVGLTFTVSADMVIRENLSQKKCTKEMKNATALQKIYG